MIRVQKEQCFFSSQAAWNEPFCSFKETFIATRNTTEIGKIVHAFRELLQGEVSQSGTCNWYNGNIGRNTHARTGNVY